MNAAREKQFEYRTASAVNRVKPQSTCDQVDITCVWPFEYYTSKGFAHNMHNNDSSVLAHLIISLENTHRCERCSCCRLPERSLWCSRTCHKIFDIYSLGYPGGVDCLRRRLPERSREFWFVGSDREASNQRPRYSSC